MSERQEGEFQGMVLTKLDSLAVMGTDIRDCLKGHETRIRALEQTATQARTLAVVAGVVSGFLGPKLAALLGLGKVG